MRARHRRGRGRPPKSLGRAAAALAEKSFAVTAATLLFNGGSVAEIFDVTANGAPGSPATWAISSRTSTTVEKIAVNALGGPDTITVNDLEGTE